MNDVTGDPHGADPVTYAPLKRAINGYPAPASLVIAMDEHSVNVMLS